MLTPAQRSLLKKAHKVAEFFPREAHPETIRSLADRGLVAHSDHGRGYYLTPAGMEALRGEEQHLGDST